MHQQSSLPLEVPEPGRPYSRTAQRLGWHPAAAALVTLGWLARAQVSVRESSEHHAARTAFFIHPRPGQPEGSRRHAEKLLAHAIPAHKKSLHLTQPAHPFLAALAAVDNLAALLQWQRDGGALPAAYQIAPAGAAAPPAFLTLFTPAEALRARLPLEMRPWDRAAHLPVFAISDATVAAALIACGFIPCPDLVPTSAGPAIGFGPASATLPVFNFQHIEGAIAEVNRADSLPPGTLNARVITLPGFPPDEHPFLYALRAARNVGHLNARAIRAAGDPIRQFVNRYQSKRTALVTDHLLGSDPKYTTLQRELDKHLQRTA